YILVDFFFSSRRRHTRFSRDWSSDVCSSDLDNDFVCNITACKGECCIDGEAGAPVEDEETEILAAIYPKVKPFLRPEGIAAIERSEERRVGREGRTRSEK